MKNKEPERELAKVWETALIEETKPKKTKKPVRNKEAWTDSQIEEELKEELGELEIIIEI